MTIDDKAFARFLARHKSDLNRISRHTRGEESLESVQSEAWMLLHDLIGKCVAIDLDLPEHCSLVISYLYQKLVRYTELHIRNAVRLDQELDGDDSSYANPLLNRLAADEQYDPLVALECREAQAQRSSEDLLNPHRSLASAYLELLAHFGNEMARVAQHLMISLSYCYQRCAHAKELAKFQRCLPAALHPGDEEFVPGPWRRFRLMRKPEQLILDFGECERAVLFSPGGDGGLTNSNT